MYPTLKQFVGALKNKKLKIATGEPWLAQRFVKGIQVLEGVDASKNVDYGDILLLSGIGLENIEENLLSILADIKKKEATLVLRTGRYIKSIPDTVISYCEQNKMILLEIDEAVKLQPIIKSTYALLFDAEKNQQSMETMMKNLIEGRYSSIDAENAYHIGFEAENSYVTAIIVVDNFFDVRERIGNDSFCEVQMKVINRLDKLLRIRGREVKFSLIEKNDIVVFIKNKGEFLEKKYMHELFSELKMVLVEDGRNITISVGISTPFNQLTECRCSVIEARRSLQILHACNRKDTVRCYEDIGIYRILFELQDQEGFRSIMGGIIGRLQEYDVESHENLTETLRVYLENDKNIGLSATKMYLHRNTLKYRLNKIEEILQCDLSDVNICFNLRLAFKIDCFLQSERNYYE